MMIRKFPFTLLLILVSVVSAEQQGQLVTARSTPATVNGPLGKLPQYLPLDDVIAEAENLAVVRSQAIPVVCPIDMSKPECDKRQPPLVVLLKDSFE